MRVEHLAIDGSVVSIEAEADLTTPATATGWAIVPSLMQAHPFTIYPAGHSAVIEEAVRASVPSLEIIATEEYSVKDGTLRVAEVRVPAATGDHQTLTVGAWEGQAGCLHTSMWGLERSLLVEVFETLNFGSHSRGLAIDSPVVSQPRAPQVVKEVPQLGILNIRPAIASELESVPEERGAMVDNGELFRFKNVGQSLLFVSNSSVVTVNPLPTGPELQAQARAQMVGQMLEVAQGLRIEWTPRTR